jgi:antirestriction protein
MNETATAHTQDHNTNTTPRIYVASLADYNSGRLLGRWIDADQEAEAIHAEIQAILATSPDLIAEEWAIHDHEGFGPWSPREYESIETVAAVARWIADVGEVFGGLMNHLGDLDEAARYMGEAYRGEWDSLQDYVESFIDDIYGHELNKLPEILRYHIDYEGIARDFELSGDIFTIELDHKVHVFDSNI